MPADQLDLLEPLWAEAPELVRPDYAPEMSIQERFELFNQRNPFIYEAAVRLAKDLRNRGHKRIGIKMILEVVRWEHARSTQDPTCSWKINNSYSSRYARMIAENVPELADAFETRELRA